VKNTDFVYGLTVFTGHDTKVMKNAAKSRYKTSNLEKMTNRSVLLILIVQIILAFIGGFIGNKKSK